MHRIIFVSFFMVLYLHAKAQNPKDYTFDIHSPENTLFLENTHLLILHDPQKSLTIYDLNYAQNKFHIFNPQKDQLKPFEVYWVKFFLKSHMDSDSDWMLSLGKLSFVEVYTSRTPGKYFLRRSGQFLPNAERDVEAGRFNSISLFLPAQETLEVLVRFENQINYPPDPNLRLINKHYWQDILIKDNLTQGFFHGLLWMMLLYNLLLFFRTGDRAYFYYVIYILTTSIYMLNFYGYWGEFFLGQFPVFNYLYLPFTAYIAFVFYLQFMRYFLRTPEKMPLWDTLIRILNILFIIVSIGQISLASTDYQLYMFAEKYVNTGVFSILLIILLWMLIAGDRIARYFALGTAFMALGTIILLVGSAKMLNIPFNQLYYQIGIVLELSVFSLGLSERYRESLKDKKRIQLELIYQLEENRNLQTKVNRELEEKVRERTHEIEEQKAEILSQREEIASQRDLMEHQNQALEEKNKHITDSIVYASRIQGAILHDYQKIESVFEEGFIFFQPKDIVSGDFYWYNEVNTYAEVEMHQMRRANSERFLGSPLTRHLQMNTTTASPSVRTLKVIAVADCTGHGVPGAFMTMMGNSILNEIILDKQITEPELILKVLDSKVINTLKKRDSEQQIYDGMEISLVVYDEATQQLKFAGTGNALYLLRDFDIHIIKPDKYSIGYSSYYRNKTFTQQTFKVRKDDIFYLASDGFQDQFGGKNGRKYMKKNFRQLLLKISHLPLSEQKEFLQLELDSWRKDYPQTDDITVVGIKFH